MNTGYLIGAAACALAGGIGAACAQMLYTRFTTRTARHAARKQRM